MSKNNLYGDIGIAAAIFERLPLLNYLDLSYNSIFGNLPNFNLPSISYLNLYVNRMTGTIPDFQGMPNIEHLQVDGNGLEGTMPDFSVIPKIMILRFGISDKLAGTSF